MATSVPTERVFGMLTGQIQFQALIFTWVEEVEVVFGGRVVAAAVAATVLPGKEGREQQQMQITMVEQA